jgi:tetratricopeptide (TPR) repeat protein
MRLARQDTDGARQALGQALIADPWYISPYRPLLLIELSEERWEEVERICSAMLKLNPYLADIRYHLGVANLRLGRVAEAAVAAQEIAAGPDAESFALRHHLEGLILERQGKTLEAEQAYRRYLELSPDGVAAEEVERRLEALAQP